MFENFKLQMIDTGEAKIMTRYGGSGQPLLLLHGHPQTHVMWHKIAENLAEEFTVVVTDLRGYGDSSKPPTTPDHEPYSKRSQARDQIEVMRQLGFEKFFVAGHDRGGHCSHRMAIDYPEQILKIAVLDIVPVSELFRHPDAREFGMEYWGWFFLAQSFDMPERLIGADPDYYYWHRRWKDEIPDFFTPEAFAEYRRCFNNSETIHAFCEDYRANASIDFALEEADRKNNCRITCPLLALWSKHDELEKWYDVLAIWQKWATDVRGRSINCGHYLAEEAPQEVFEELKMFFAE